ncbi:hypothetical protein GCM10010836_05340 [Aminobacter aminovorans]
MEPAKSIVDRLGGPNAVSAIVGVHRTRVYGWMRSREDGGTGGVIPLKHAHALLAAAADKGIPLTAAEFFPASETVA